MFSKCFQTIVHPVYTAQQTENKRAPGPLQVNALEVFWERFAHNAHVSRPFGRTLRDSNVLKGLIELVREFHDFFFVTSVEFYSHSGGKWSH